MSRATKNASRRQGYGWQATGAKKAVNTVLGF
jgi:hypothetical protein